MVASGSLNGTMGDYVDVHTDQAEFTQKISP
ncbi:MAG: hypothetical protein QG597_2292 [Actinomycetota bacterium]|nr:hypothetical protein [Actinomycetota bacterium]